MPKRIHSDIATPTTVAESLKKKREILDPLPKEVLRAIGIMNMYVVKQQVQAAACDSDEPESPESPSNATSKAVKNASKENKRDFMEEFERLEKGPGAVFALAGQSDTVGGEMVRCVSNLIRGYQGGYQDETDIEVCFDYLESFGEEFSRKAYLIKFANHASRFKVEVKKIVKKSLLFIEDNKLFDKQNTIDYQRKFKIDSTM